MILPNRYDDIGTTNAVKLIPKISSYNGYIQLYTQIDSHIEVGDTVFITYSGDTAELGDFDLDNMYNVLQSEDFLYNNYAQGYKVLYTNKNTNSFVIDRFIYTLPVNSKVYGHYVSSVVANNMLITNGEINGTFMKNSTIIPTNEIVINQVLMLYGQINNVDIKDKYATGYISLLLKYDEDNDTFIKYSNLNNNEYGYSYFYDIPEILDCNFYSGLYINSKIYTTSSTKKIDGGFYSNCNIDNYEIYNGYMNNTTLSNTCLWYNGSWDGGTFDLSNWTNGTFIGGTFGNNNNAIWENGTFYDGVWAGLYWINGSFAGGQFKGQDNYVNGEGQIIYSEWLSGKFIDGKMYNSDFYSNSSSGHSFYVKTITISGGEIYNASIYNGNINGGKIYNSSIKNCDICAGNFVANLKDVDYKYNRISNCNIYGGDFVGEWWSPIYLNSNSSFTDSIYGLNEISESTIYNGNFKYTHFYNYNEIKNGIYDNCLFLSPTNVYDGVFKNGTSNNIKLFDGVSYTIDKRQKSNYFSSEKFSFSKATIRKKELLNSSGDLITKILLEFDKGHNFSSGDISKTIQLTGFKSQELWNSNFTILSANTYYDPSTYGASGNTLPYEYFDPVGETYIVLNEHYNEWYYNDSGIVRKVDYYDLLSETNKNFYNIYNGKYSNCYMTGVEIPMQVAIDDDEIDTSLARTVTKYGNIKIYLGNFKNSYLQNGIIWFNGQFDGGKFVSDFGTGVENHWFSGDFYEGIFGDNLGGDLETMTLSMWYNNSLLIDKSGSTGESTTDWKLTKIYPLRHASFNSHNVGSASFSPLNRSTSISLPDFSDDYAKSTMNIEPWSQSNINNVIPYEFIFVVECSDSDAVMKMKSLLETFEVGHSADYYIGIIDPTRINQPQDENNPLYISEPYKLFERLYTDNYDYNYVDYYYNENVETNIFYLRFRFNEIERLYANSTDDEFEHFNLNYRSAWSLANTGYYTYPMPVLYGDGAGEDYYGNEDLLSVGKFVIYGVSRVNDNSDWIYGTCPPPWWYNVTANGVPSISWSNALVGTITKISTKRNFHNLQINNNGKPVDYFEIDSNDILPRLQRSWILIDLYGDPLSNYPGDFKHINGVTTSRDSNPIPYRRKLVEWYRHYIYLNKNKTGFNFVPTIRYDKVHDENKTKQLLYDPDFNNVEDYKTEPIWDLGGIQNGRINHSDRPAMIYNTKSYDAKLVGNKLYFSNTVNFNDRNEEDLFNFGDGWDNYLRIAIKSDPTQLVFEDNFISGNLSGNYSGISTGTGTSGSTGTNLNASALPSTPQNNVNIFQNGTYKVKTGSTVKYKYDDNILENYLVLDETDTRVQDLINDNVTIDVEVFKQNRGIILPYYYKIQQNTPASILSYKDYGSKLSLKMEPIFHNYAFNGKKTFNTENFINTGYFDNRNIFGVRLMKLISDSNGEIIKNNHYRIIFNSLYETPDKIFKKCDQETKINEPIIGARSFYSNNLPLIEGESYYVDVDDLLESLKYSVNSKNWISLLNFSESDSYTYNNFLTNNIFTGTWSISNSGLTGTDNQSYYNIAEEFDCGGSITTKNRVYFDIVDNNLDVNYNRYFPTLLKDEDSYINGQNTTSQIWNGTNNNDYYLPDTSYFTNDILNYLTGNSSTNYTRFSSGFNPIISSGFSVNTISTYIKNNSQLTQWRDILQYSTLSSHTDFRVKDSNQINVSKIPTRNVPTGAIRFPDVEVNNRRTGAIWIEKPGNWEDNWSNDMDRHYRLKVKIIRRTLYNSGPNILNTSNTKISVIFGDQMYTKNGDDLINIGGTRFPTIEFEVYHHLIKGEQWTDNFIGVILENAEYDSDCLNEYYITEMSLDYDPLNYVDMFATLEPQVECAGRIVKIRTKYDVSVGTKYKTISTKILDYDWINKSYIFDVDAVASDLPNFNNNNYIHLATNMRSYNNFNYSNNISDYGTFDVHVGYDNSKKWILPPWSTNENRTLSDTTNITETIYQTNFTNNFSNKDCMIDIRYSTNYKYVDGTGPSANNNDYHDSMGNNPYNNPINYYVINNNGDIKETQMSLINLTDFNKLGKEYYDYGILNTSTTYQDFSTNNGISTNAFPELSQNEMSSLNYSIFESELTDEEREELITQQVYYYQDNIDYWFGPLKSYFNSTVLDSSIQDSEHPAYWKGGQSFYKECKRSGSYTGTIQYTSYGIYEPGTPMLHNHIDSNNFFWTYEYYENATFDGNGNITSVSNLYSYNNGFAPSNMNHMRAWKHIGMWTNTKLNNYWVHGAYEGQNDLQCNYVDLFKTIPMNDSGLQNILSTDGIAITINQPNVYFSDTYNNDDSIKRNVITSVKIVEKVTTSEFDTISETTPAINYENYRIDGFDGMKKFGLQEWRHNNIFRIMSHNYLFNYNGYNPEYNLVWYYELDDFKNRHNFHDIALFNAYHISKVNINNGIDTNYQDILFDEQLNNYNISISENRTIYNMFNDMENADNTYVSQYSDYFTDEIREKFEHMNEYDQTSVQNFNKKSGIQIYTKNINISPSSYTDHWYDGTFYGGIFNGKWYSGQWVNGVWGPGYNYIQSTLSNYYFDQLSSPDFVNIGFVEKKTYEVNYSLLKQKNEYYDIAPWDDANKKKSEVVKLPLRKKDRKI